MSLPLGEPVLRDAFCKPVEIVTTTTYDAEMPGAAPTDSVVVELVQVTLQRH